LSTKAGLVQAAQEVALAQVVHPVMEQAAAGHATQGEE
jgi:hypothetical protein